MPYWSARTTMTTWTSNGGVEDEVEEPRAERRADAGGGDLLELVDHEELGTLLVDLVDRLERGHRVGARNHHVRAPWRGARQPATANEREESGAHEGRLAAPGRTDDGNQPAVEHPRRELGDEPLPPDEEVGVLRAVRGQRTVWLATRPGRAHERITMGPGRNQAQHLVEDRGVGIVGDGRRGERRGGRAVRAGLRRRAPSRRRPRAGRRPGGRRRRPSAAAVASSSAPSACRMAARSASSIGGSSIAEPLARSMRRTTSTAGPPCADRGSARAAGTTGPRRRQALRPPGRPWPASIRHHRPRRRTGRRRHRSTTASTTRPTGSDPATRADRHERIETVRTAHVLDGSAIGDHRRCQRRGESGAAGSGGTDERIAPGPDRRGRRTTPR